MLGWTACTLTHRFPPLGDTYASSDELAEADLVGEAEELLNVADEEECELAVGLGELVVGGSVGFFDAVAVGVAEADFDAVAEGVGEGLLLGGGLLGGGLLGGGLLGRIGSGLQIGPVPAAEAAA